MSLQTQPPVPFDPQIQPVVDFMATQPPMSRESIAASRGVTASPFPSAEELVKGLPITITERVIPGPEGAPDLEITVLSPSDLRAEERLPALYNIHGGGMVVGHRSWESGRLVDLMTRHRVVCVNVEYRLAPEDPFPAGAEDVYAGFVWTHANAAELGVDASKIVVMGGSAGGGFSAAIALMARDRQGPIMAGQLLLCPMIDNTGTTVSAQQYRGLGTWTREANDLSWACVLGEELAFSEGAPAYAAPSRADDLSGLPPAFIEVGAAETFRDEDVEYASRIWAVGGQAELHVWDGGCHGFDMYAPDAIITQAALDSRDSWLRRIFA